MVAARTFLTFNPNEWQAISVVLGVVVTLLVGWRQLAHARKTRDDETRPFIIVDFHFRSILACISVRNVGRTAARNVVVRLDGPVASTVMSHVAWAGKGVFGSGVSMFAPGREMLYPLDVMSKRPDSGLPMTFTGEVEYSRPHNDARLVERFELDLTVFMDSMLPPRDLTDLANEVYEIRKILAQTMPPLRSSTVAAPTRRDGSPVASVRQPLLRPHQTEQ